MSNIIIFDGPIMDRGMAERIRAIVIAVATCPSSSSLSIVPVGKYGRTKVRDLKKLKLYLLTQVFITETLAHA